MQQDQIPVHSAVNVPMISAACRKFLLLAERPTLDGSFFNCSQKCCMCHALNYLTLWSPSPSKAQSLPTCCAAHSRVQILPTYSCTYYNLDDLNSGLSCMEAFTKQPSIWCWHLWTFCHTISKKQ